MEKLGPCKKFSGYPKDNGAKFLKEFESFAKLNELNDRDEEPRKLAAFHLHLQGPALTWYNGLHPDLDWNTIRDMFVEKYATIGWHNPSVVAECENFQNVVLGASQEIEDFYCQILEKGQLLSKPDHEIMFKFINGLPEKLAFYVRSSKPKDISEALTLARAGEAYKYRVHDKFLTVAAAQANANVNSEISELKQQVGELTDLFKQFGSEKKVRYQVNPGQINQNTQYQPRGRTGLSCYNCNGNGHTKRYCNWNGTGNVCPDVACQICKQMGHTALQCLNNFYQDKNTNEVCQLCFQVGHVAANCQNFQSNVYYNQNSGNRTALGDARHGRPGKR